LYVQCLSNQDCIKNNLPLKFKCNLCSNEWEENFIIIPNCPKCEENFLNSRSKEEGSLARWLKENTTETIIINKRFNCNGKIYEGDIVIEDKKLIIELNGLFWHSEIHGNKNKNYHINKLNSLNKLGYDIIQIFEDEWVYKPDIIKNKLLYKLGYYRNKEKIYARKCNIKSIDNVTANNFIEKTHIQGKTNASYCYGAFYKNELIAVMTFSKLRLGVGNNKNNKDSYEIVRFSTVNDRLVIGIAGKLFCKFIKDHNPVKIISYVDRRWSSEDNVYNSLKMKLIKITSPNYWYVKKLSREYRFKYNKRKLVSMGNNPNLTEWEIMQSMGYDRIWDCGHYKYQWN